MFSPKCWWTTMTWTMMKTKMRKANNSEFFDYTWTVFYDKHFIRSDKT